MRISQQISGNDPFTILSERIKEELFSSFKRNGIGVSGINIDLKDETMNISVNISEDEAWLNLVK